MASMEIHAVKSVSGTQPRVARIIEKLTQTFLSGTPVQVDTAVDGGVKEWGAAAGTDLIAGFAVEPASNLASTGAGAPSGLTPVLGSGSGTTFGAVPYQSSAKNIPRGAPMSDGRIGFETAAADNLFLAQVGPAQTTAATDVGKSYGLTKDADNHWYVDKTKTGANAVVKIEKLYMLDAVGATAGRVLFSVEAADAQIIG
jgi:hypothetical protein